MFSCLSDGQGEEGEQDEVEEKDGGQHCGGRNILPQVSAAAYFQSYW